MVSIKYRKVVLGKEDGAEELVLEGIASTVLVGDKHA
jgi:hypothetical protein